MTSCAGYCSSASHFGTNGFSSFLTKRVTVSDRALCSVVNFMCLVSLMSCSETRDAEGVAAQRASFGLASERQRQREHAARVARVDHAVVPQPRRAEQHVRLAVDAIA